MKTVISIILSAIILFMGILPNGDFHELSELPQLYEHFKNHEEDSATQSFVEFLADHYGQTHSEESEHHQDMPFNHCHHNCCSITYTFSPSIGLNITPRITPAVVATTQYTGILPSAPSSSIWQPPKI